MGSIYINILLTAFVVVYALITQGTCQEASIISVDRTITVQLKSEAQLECIASNFDPTSDKVVWEFVDHNITISVNDVIKTASITGKSSKYALFRPQDTSSEGFWNLSINDVVVEDQGSYRCYIDGRRGHPNGQVMYKLDVQGAPAKPDIPDLDVTDCCLTSGVESCGQPLCRTNTSLTDLMNIFTDDKCLKNNLVKVLVCAQDGRNHVGCCIRLGVSDHCQTMCDARDLGIDLNTTDVDFTSCIGITTLSIRQCLMEGQVLFPSPPVDVSAVSTGSSLLVVWKSPLENVAMVTGYRVQYRPKGENQTFSSTAVLPTDVNYYRTANAEALIEDTVYEVRVMAISQFGASQPSYLVDIATGSVNPATFFNNDTVQDCCRKKNVTPDCQGYCLADQFNIFIHPDSVVSCYSKLEIMYRCLSGEGNHTGCCKRVQVPEECHPLCSGQVVMSSDVLMNCILYMPLISACMVEGANFLPGSPRNTRLVSGSVTSDSATVSWDAPADSSGDILYYYVAWKMKNSRYQDTKVVQVQGTSHKMTGLQSTTVYEVEVMSVNDHGSSLPELTLVFVTEGLSTVRPTPYDEIGCCRDKGVPEDCLALCNHTYRLTSDALIHGLKCPDSILPMLQCATDGRDHTDCCLRKGITDKCLDLCKLHPSMVPSTDLLECVLQKDNLSVCFDVGKATLPKAPSELEVESISESAIILDWAVPSGPNVTKYRVLYGTDPTQAWTLKTTDQTHMDVNNLEADTMYYFKVESQNENGLSLPTSVIAAYTLPIPVDDTKVDWPQYYQNVSDCCQQKVSADCYSMCTNPANSTQSCVSELDDILLCAADGRNHERCCLRYYTSFPEACLPLCKGQKPSLDAYSALCMGYSKMISSCFVEGKGLLPSPPQRLRVTSYSHEEIMIQWKIPEDNCNETSCMYGTMLWQGEDSTALPDMMKTNKKSFTFGKLSAETKYRVSVEAYNAHGSSLPAPLIIVITKPHPTLSVVVDQFPTGVVDTGTQLVQLTCSSYGESQSISWRRNKQLVSGNFSLQLDKVDKTQEGVYTCVVQFENDVTQKKDLFLNVRYLPLPSKMKDVSMFPGLHQNAELTCEFHGFPDIVTWTKDGEGLAGNSKYYVEPVQISLETGIITSLLRVKDVHLEDYGTYTCTGKNKFGEQSLTGQLKNADASPPTMPPSTGTDVAGCCRSRNISELCIGPICTYTIDLNAIISDISLTSCLAHIEDFFICGADGRDHTSCCEKEGVPEFCQPFCAGKVPDVSDPLMLLSCVQHAYSLSNCIVNGTQYIPSVPQNVMVAIDYDTVKVTWKQPVKNPDKVHVYHIYYIIDTAKDSTSKPMFSSVSRSQKSFRLPNVLKGKTYFVWMEAVNDFGKSLVSNKLQITVDKLLPLEPQNLRVDLLDGLAARITWQPPRSTVPIQMYNIEYRMRPDGNILSSRSMQTDIRLERLSPNTKYEIKVMAIGIDGPGKASSEQYFITGDASPSGTMNNLGTETKGSGSKVGLAIGLIMAVLVLVALGVMAVCFYRRVLQRKNSSGSQGTVAFENPRYTSNAKVTGLPGESTSESHQFEFGRLQEETDDHEPSYTASQSDDAPATLNIM